MVARQAPITGYRKAKTGINSVSEVIDNVQRIFNNSRQFYHQHFEYSVIVNERDAIYSDINTWLMSILPTDKHRAVEVTTGKGFHDDVVEASNRSSGDYKIKPLTIRFNESIERKIHIGKHVVKVSIQVPETSQGGMNYDRLPKKIQFTTATSAGQKAVLDKLEELNQTRATSRKAVLKMVGSWGDWTTRSDLPPRTMDSVSLPKDQKERIINDLKEFLDSENDYNRLAIPWHRGYMFEGPPGTGKTSLVKALANEFNLDLWYVSLSDLSKESSLLSLLAGVSPRSLLLLEDIDTMEITHDRDSSEQGKISIGSLLNTLDGVATPHGLITVMTTNRFEILDPALTRAGRMDLIEKIDYPTVSVISDMYRHFYGGRMVFWNDIPWTEEPFEGISTSQIAEIMKRNMRDKAKARKEIEVLLKGEK